MPGRDVLVSSEHQQLKIAIPPLIPLCFCVPATQNPPDASFQLNQCVDSSTAELWHIDEFKPIPQNFGLSGRIDLIQCTRAMRVQVVDYQHNLPRFVITLGNPSEKPRPARLCAPPRNPDHVFAGQRLERHEYVARPHTAILRVLSFGLPRRYRHGRMRLTDQLVQRLIC